METKYLSKTNDSVEYVFPGIDLLDNYSEEKPDASDEEVKQNCDEIRTLLLKHRLEKVEIDVIKGSVVTMYKILLGKIGIHKINFIAEDLQWCDWGARVTVTKGIINMEIPNRNPSKILLKDILGSEDFLNTEYELPIAVGTDITGKAKVVDLANAPHILVGGAAGQGKTVFLNTVITSLLYAKRPDELKFVLIHSGNFEYAAYSKLSNSYLTELQLDEKQNEISSPILNQPKQVKAMLLSLCKEMNNRYTLMSKVSVDNIKSYNKRCTDECLNTDKSPELLPYMVVIIDEYADFISSIYSHNIMTSIISLAQKGCAVGIHMIIATKQTKQTVITELVKACFPTKIAFKVPMRVDSQTILDTSGAQALIGNGDMLYLSRGNIERIQGGYVNISKISQVVNFISSQNVISDYKLALETVVPDRNYTRDSMFDEAVKLVSPKQFCTPATLQKGLVVGYNRACNILIEMEEAGIVGAETNTGKRTVLLKKH